MAASVWSERRRVELEAASRFRDLARRLAEHGAGGVVVTMAREAADDEVRHAALCATLVEHFGGRAAEDAVVPTRVGRVAPAGLAGREALLFEIVALCCVTETLSTALLGALVDAARDSLAKQTMRSILRDEVRHSRLGWAYVAEAHAVGMSDVCGEHLGAMIAGTLGPELLFTTPPSTSEAELAGYGALEREQRVRIVRECFHEVIFPGLERFGIDVRRGRAWLAERLGP